jgi:hypothetical protein
MGEAKRIVRASGPRTLREPAEPLTMGEAKRIVRASGPRTLREPAEPLTMGEAKRIVRASRPPCASGARGAGFSVAV